MHSLVVGNKFVATRQIQIGRLFIDIAFAEPRLVCSREVVSSVGDSFYLLVIPLTGTLSFSQSGRSGVAKAGEYVLLSQMEFYELASEGSPAVILLRIPARELRGRLASVDDHISRRFSANELMARLLVDLIRGVTDIFADRPPPNPEALATEIVGFVALALGAEDRGAAIDVRNARYHLRRRIFDFIEKNLNDHHLSPKKIAASSRISLSYLYSLFNDDDTTVGQFVQLKRLQRAYELLVADQKGHRTVSEVAYEVGFKNVSHFSRSFSRQFRMAPRDVRSSARMADRGVEAAATTTRKWESAAAIGRLEAPFHSPLSDAV